eukprot:SAG31_NODE_2191_length_6228_cov_2.962806_6_plen_208_part_00
MHIIRHKPGAVFSTPVEVIIVDDRQNIVRVVEPSGSVGTQYPKEIGSQWMGTVENLNAGLAAAHVSWADVYKTDVMWTTPSTDREECDKFKNDFNAVYKPMIDGLAGGHGPLVSNRMARFTHQEGFPDMEALFEVQIKAVSSPTVTIDAGSIDYGYWRDHQPSGASTMHTNASGEIVTKVDGGARAEFDFIVRAHGHPCSPSLFMPA